MTPKKIGKSFLCHLLEQQVKTLRRKNDFKIVAVAGSVGKTSTKLAIAKTLSANRKVIYQEGNYNDRLTVPLIFFNQAEPGIYNIFAWFKILRANRQQLKRKYPSDTMVVELGTDAPGQLKKFAYLKPDITVITAVADEHMQYFGSLDAVAREELAPLEYSQRVLINVDDVPGQYLPETEFVSYGLTNQADYHVAKHQSVALQGQQMIFKLPSDREITSEVAVLGEQGAKIAAAAVAVADMLRVSDEDIQRSLKAITPVAGRMQILAGKNGSLIIDDTYNASPVAVIAALDVLYRADAKQRIAILGSMNELGADSQQLHEEIARHCDPNKLDLLVTIGREAADYLAPAAEQQGCVTKTCMNPYEAGQYVQEQVKTGAVILAKGSQNGVFAEEAVKILLANQAQARKLVRQSNYWLKVKKNQFPANT